MTSTEDADIFVDDPATPTKEIPCGECGRLCVVGLFARVNKVRCFQHHPQHGRKAGRRMPGASIRDPFEPGLAFDERVNRLRGRTIILHREVAGISFAEELAPGWHDKRRYVDGLRSFAEGSGIVQVLCEHGGFRWFELSEVEAVK